MKGKTEALDERIRGTLNADSFAMPALPGIDPADIELTIAGQVEGL